MGITFNETDKVFYLHTKNTTYAMQIFKNKYLVHLYWGRKVASLHPENVLFVDDNLSNLKEALFYCRNLPCGFARCGYSCGKHGGSTFCFCTAYW